jgi:carboxyl-terminal processing protease
MKNLLPQLAHSPEKTGAAKFTVQKYYLPNGSSTQLKGIVPDIVLPSIDDYLQIGEGSLPHALVWDEIPTSFFDGAPLEPKVLKSLQQSSTARQDRLEEFLYLRKYVDWFRARQAQKLVSLNLADRREQKTADDKFRKEMDAEKERLVKTDYPYREFRLGPPPPPRIKAAKKSTDTTDDDDEELSTDEDAESYAKLDVHLRESLRVLNDALALGHDQEYWASNHPPLTAAIDRKG